MSQRYIKAAEYTAKYKKDLLPCRHCKGTNTRIVSERTVFDPKNVWYVACCDCGDCASDSTSVRQAIKNWNSDEFRRR